MSWQLRAPRGLTASAAVRPRSVDRGAVSAGAERAAADCIDAAVSAAIENAPMDSPTLLRRSPATRRIDLPVHPLACRATYGNDALGPGLPPTWACTGGAWSFARLLRLLIAAMAVASNAQPL
jgi:hypothetical protein